MRCYNCQNSHKEFNNDYECVYMPQCLMADVERRLSYECFDLSIGKQVKFSGERYWWTIVARNERFLICIRKSKKVGYYYTICDLQECIRGKDNLCFCTYDYQDPKVAEQALRELNRDRLQISYRNWLVLEIVEVR